MPDRRKYKRSRSPKLLPVTDVNTQQCIGRLVDLSLGGMLMMAVQPIPVHRIFQLRVNLPIEINGNNVIEFGAESVWGDPPEHIGTYWAGFQVIDISEYNKESVSELVDIWSKQDAAAVQNGI